MIFVGTGYIYSIETYFTTMATQITKTQFMKGFDSAKNALAKLKPKKRNGKRHQMGIGGRAGAVTAGVGPLAVSGIGAGAQTIDWIRNPNPNSISQSSAVMAGVFLFFNNLSQGFLGKPIYDKMNITLKNGNRSLFNIGAETNVPAGSHWGLVITGGTMVVIDKVLSKIMGQGVNIPQTNIRAIGS